MATDVVDEYKLFMGIGRLQGCTKEVKECGYEVYIGKA